MSQLEDQFELQQGSQEKNSQRNGAIVTIIVHSIIIFFFMVTMAWVAPDPPLPKYGIEVNFGFETEGSGNIQNKTNPNKSESLEKAKPNPKPVEKVEDAKPDPVPEPVKEEVTPVKTEPDITPVTDEAEEAVEVPKKEEPEPKKEEEKEVKTPKGSDASDNTGKAEDDLANNDGNKKDDVGDEGKKDGSVNADALLGGGSGGGATLKLDGWQWGEPPSNVENSSETGSVTIKFKINDDGEVMLAMIVSRTISSTTAEKYRKYVEDTMYFEPKDNVGEVANFTFGSITFIIKSK